MGMISDRIITSCGDCNLWCRSMERSRTLNDASYPCSLIQDESRPSIVDARPPIPAPLLKNLPFFKPSFLVFLYLQIVSELRLCYWFSNQTLNSVERSSVRKTLWPTPMKEIVIMLNLQSLMEKNLITGKIESKIYFWVMMLIYRT